MVYTILRVEDRTEQRRREMATITGEMAKTLRNAGLPSNATILQAIDPYTVIDLAAAIEAGDDDVIAQQLGWIDMLITENMVLAYVGDDRPDTSVYGQCIDAGGYRSLYERSWRLYEDDQGIWRYVIRHTHANDNSHGKAVEWFVFERR